MISVIRNRFKTKEKTEYDELFTPEKAREVYEFHRAMDEYNETPLVSLERMASISSVGKIYVKDESYRFGLNAFKILGGSYAIGKYLENVKGDKEVTFISATDGNHGRGVAWMAEKTGNKSVILLPKGSTEERLNNIKALGAEASITDCNYDDTVRKVRELAEKNNWVIVQDTAWEGYSDIPTGIMQGYMTLAYESINQLMGVRPTHVFVQAGVGSLAGAVVGYLSQLYKENPPISVVVESDAADCYFQSMSSKDGEPKFVDGDLSTIMAGLACGEPNLIGYKILKNKADFFMKISDEVAAKGMRILGNPLMNDKKIVAGESGAAGFGALMEALLNKEIREALLIDENSVILTINTEGDTDVESYIKIMNESNGV